MNDEERQCLAVVGLYLRSNLRYRVESGEDVEYNSELKQSIDCIDGLLRVEEPPPPDQYFDYYEHLAGLAPEWMDPLEGRHYRLGNIDKSDIVDVHCQCCGRTRQELTQEVGVRIALLEGA